MRALGLLFRLLDWFFAVRDFLRLLSPKHRKRKREEKAREDDDEIYGEE